MNWGEGVSINQYKTKLKNPKKIQQLFISNFRLTHDCLVFGGVNGIIEQCF